MMGVNVFSAWAFKAGGALEDKASSIRHLVTPLEAMAVYRQTETFSVHPKHAVYHRIAYLIATPRSSDQHPDETQDQSRVDDLLLGPVLQREIVRCWGIDRRWW